MRIEYKNPADRRTINVGNKAYTFTPSGKPGVLACDIPDDDVEALETLLSERNRNLFNVAIRQREPLLARTPAAPAQPAKPAAPTPTPAAKPDAPPAGDGTGDAGGDIGTVIAKATELLALSVRKVEAELDSVTDKAVIRQAIEIEAAKSDPRSTVIAALDKRLKQLSAS